MPFKFLSTSNLLNNMPVVQNRRCVSLPLIPSSRTLYPTHSPNVSPLSEATLSETDIAEIRLGCVHIMLQAAPRIDSISDSNMN
uniref:ATP-dependent RNA helicase DHX36 isoform X1 n=1 Tax=Rhizophora mucronata TaxID=61149 RepID=A0A2P2KTD4_RHIMU